MKKLNKYFLILLKIKPYLKYYLYKNSSNILPINYEKLTYIETDGNSYIDSNALIDNNSKVYVKFRTANNIPTNLSTVLFYSGSSIGYGFAIGATGAQGKYRIFYYNTARTGESALNTETDYEILFDKNKFILNNELKFTFNMATFITPYTLPFFAQYFQRDTSPVNYATSGTRIYEIKIWDNNKIVRHMVPCKRKEDNVIGMYDIINDNFYINKGSGNFIGG